MGGPPHMFGGPPPFEGAPNPPWLPGKLSITCASKPDPQQLRASAGGRVARACERESQNLARGNVNDDCNWPCSSFP
jgi:hypothetical protein